MKRTIPPILLTLLLVAPARAGLPPSPAQLILDRAPTPEALRASLAAAADSLAPLDRYASGECLYLIGLSDERAGAIDSAIVAYERAVERRGDRPEILALADALLARGKPEDLRRVAALLAPAVTQAGGENVSRAAPYLARLAWCRFLAGHPDSAMATFRAISDELGSSAVWRFRMARTEFALGPSRAAYALLEPLAIESRGTDTAVMGMIQEVASDLGVRRELDPQLERAVAARDRARKAWVDSLGGDRIRFRADDGFMLGAVTLGAGHGRGRRPAVVLVSPGDSLASYDSLAVTLHDAGFVVMLLEPRGQGWSVGPTAPLPGSWYGRGDAFRARTAADAVDALDLVSRMSHADSTAALVVGVGPSAGAAIEAASRDPRYRALMLVSPLPSPVERGPLAARIAAMRRPIFFQLGLEDGLESGPATELLYQAGDRRASRVSDARGAGTFAQQFRDDPSIAPRFTRWLSDEFPARPGSRGARPRSRRGE